MRYFLRWKKHMFRARLGFSFGILVALVSVQFAWVVWLVHLSETDRARSLRAKDALIQYTDLGANKQRLKVWFAQYLLTDIAPIELRDRYLTLMQTSLDVLERLYREDAQDPSALPGERVSRHTLDALVTNFSALRTGILQAQPHIAAKNPAKERAAVWAEMIGVFDMSQGQDMRILIADAITQQGAHSRAAEDAAQASLQRLRMVSLFSILTTVVLSVAFVGYFTVDIRRRLHPLLEGTRALQRGQLEHRIFPAGEDEFGLLGQSFNRMADEIQTHRSNELTQRQRLEQAVEERTLALHQTNEKLRTIDAQRRQFFANVSHELRTPTAAILGESEVTLRRSGHPEAVYQDTLRRVADIARQLGARIHELMQFARESERSSDYEKAPVGLATLVLSTMQRLESLAIQQHNTMVLVGDVQPQWQVYGNAEKLLQALSIVVDNAIRYTPAGGCIELSVAPAVLKGGEALGVWRVQVSDNGIGIQAQEAQALPQRYWRSERARLMRPDGMGLGLSIAAEIVEAHGGTLVLHPRNPQGTQVCIDLPVYSTDTVGYSDAANIGG